jgi:hypothetical protein
MLLRILFAVLIVVFVRFVLDVVRALARQGRQGGRPEVRRGARTEAPQGSGRVIDVDYTEHPDTMRKDR